MRRLTRRIPPALALFVLSPTLGELLTGSSPPLEYFNPVVFVLLASLYGCGALLCRELVIRWEKGWLSLLLLAMAYGIFEEGIVVRSFFDPEWEDLDKLGVYGRTLGVNWVWTQHLIHFHALISILASVALVEIMYPTRRHDRWLTRRGWYACWAGMGAWIPLGVLGFPYGVPVHWYAVTWLAIAGLVWAARHVPAHPFPPRDRSVPRPRRFWWLGFVGLFVYFFTVWLTADGESPHFLITMAFLLVLDALAFALILRWSGNGYAWDDRHRLALIAGGLGFFIFFDLILEMGGVLGMSLVGILTATGLWRLARRVKQRLAVAANTAILSQVHAEQFFT